MSTNILIIGESGTGKSTSLRNLNHEETYLIMALNKSLPFKGWKDKYIQATPENPEGNLSIKDDAMKIVQIMNHVSNNRPKIKTIIIDDFQYIMANMFMRRHAAANKGNAVFALYNDIGDHAWNICETSTKLRDDLTVIILSHSEQNEMGKVKCKTIGKLLDDKIVLEGMFPIVMETFTENNKYYFITHNNGHNTAKTPMDMFQEDLIENDLNLLIEAIKEY